MLRFFKYEGYEGVATYFRLVKASILSSAVTISLFLFLSFCNSSVKLQACFFGSYQVVNIWLFGTRGGSRLAKACILSSAVTVFFFLFATAALNCKPVFLVRTR